MLLAYRGIRVHKMLFIERMAEEAAPTRREDAGDERQEPLCLD